MNEITRKLQADSQIDALIVASGRRAWPTSQAADGVPRLAWTVDDLDRMTAAGLLPEGGGIELLWGELIPIAAKGIRHEVVRTILLDWFISKRPSGILVASEMGWRPAPNAYFEPEIMLFTRSATVPTMPGADVLLLIEVADTSLAYDTTLKAAAYAKLGIRDYWVVAATMLETRVFRDPSPDGFAAPFVVTAADIVTPLLLPELAIRMADAVG